MSRFNTEVLLAIILIIITSIILFVYGFNEEDRMAAASEFQQGRAI